MKRRKLEKLKRELADMRRTPQNAAALQSLASRLGRQLNTKRGKHPNWESSFGHLYPISIPDHGGRDIPLGTKKQILDALEDDVLAWEENLPDESEEEETEH